MGACDSVLKSSRISRLDLGVRICIVYHLHNGTLASWPITSVRYTCAKSVWQARRNKHENQRSLELYDVVPFNVKHSDSVISILSRSEAFF